MTKLANGREAKEFLIDRVVIESQRLGVPLTEIERKMLYFSETNWSLPDIVDVNQAFERDYDQAEYEQRMGSLIRSARESDRREGVSWKQAMRILRTEDHYLLVLIGVSEGSTEVSRERLHGISGSRFQKLVLIGLAIFVAIMGIAYTALTVWN